MERFSKFNDPSSGINPFIQPKHRPLTCIDWIKFIYLYPVYLLSFPFPFLLRLLFNIKINRQRCDKLSVGICNCSSFLDTRILKYVFGIKNFYYVRDGRYFTLSGQQKKISKPCFLFVEGTMTNNKALLQYETPTKIDYICYIKYSEVFVYGSWLRYLCRILSNGLTVEIKTIVSSDSKQLSKLGNVPVLKFNFKDKELFIKELNK